METTDFLLCAERLTGTPIKEVEAPACAALERILRDGERSMDCSQLNELLLLVNKDRVSRAFFDYFFNPPCRVADIPTGVARFQRTAMLRYGNFIYAFRTLSRMPTGDDIRAELGDSFRDSQEVLSEFTSRTPPLLPTELIARTDTPLIGYLSAAHLFADRELADFLQALMADCKAAGITEWSALETRALELSKARRTVARRLSRLKERCHASLAELEDHLRTMLPVIAEAVARLKAVRAQGQVNEGIYLTWDHMDVYFATSMRKRADYEELYDFVQKLMSQQEFNDLHLRWFDPTQSFNDMHLNKGLVESLMLKRAKCTVYSVQDIDTLGKDSELAATLAQGKPVIAYVSDKPVAQRTEELLNEDPATLHERVRFVQYFEEAFLRELPQEDRDLIQEIQAQLQRLELNRVWLTVPEPAADRPATDDPRMQRFCRILAEAEKLIYDKRARTLKEQHPLGIQVNLATGVANGVLVVRDVPTCARLLRAILTNTMDFLDVKETEDEKMWYLKEASTGSVFRIVTKDRKLTNCFWNYYQEKRQRN